MFCMWSLKVMTGPQAGQTYDLKQGRNLIGRGESCDLRLVSHGVSKEHCEIHLYPDKVMVVDLRSSNGTFINGVKIQNGILRLGDKLSVHDVIFNIIIIKQDQKKAESNLSVALNSILQEKNYSPQNLPKINNGLHGTLASPAQIQSYQQQSELISRNENQGFDSQQSFDSKKLGLKDKFQNYIDQVLLPGIYKLAQYVEFQYLILGFVTIFIFTVTFLNMNPALQLVEETIQTEALRKTRSLAKNLAQYNQAFFTQGDFAAMNTDMAEAEEGVRQVLIVQQSDGMILSPASKAGTTASVPKIRNILNETKSISFVENDLIIAASPMGTYDPVRGEGVIKAFSIVIYDLKSRKISSGRTISLFMQSLLIATLIGLILYFFMIRLIEFPLHSLNAQIDTALKEKKDQTELKYLSIPLQKLVSNINTLLSRAMSARDKEFTPIANKDLEFSIMSQSITQPLVFLSVDGKVVAANKNFEQLTMLSVETILGQHYQAIMDTNLHQSIQHLSDKAKDIPAALHSETMEVNQIKCMINCQALLNENSEVAYFMISFSPLAEENEGAA